MQEDPNDVADLLKPTGALLVASSIDLALQSPACYFVWHPVFWLLLLLVACMDMNT